MDDPHAVLIETLQAIRKERGLSNARFAREVLGISQQMWSYVTLGSKHLGPQSLTVIRERFGHLRPLINAVLTAPISSRRERVTKGGKGGDQGHSDQAA